MNYKVSCFIFLILMLSTCLFTSMEVAASELHQEDGIIPNHSIEYVRTQSRNASRDADAAFYNPAGLAMMDNKGLYIMFSSQTLHKKRLHSMDYDWTSVQDATPYEGPTENSQSDFRTNRPTGGIGGTNSYFAEVTAPVLPDLNIVYRDNTNGHDWAVFLTLGLMQAAPDFTYPKGLAVVDWGNLTLAEQLNSSIGLQAGFDRYSYGSNIAVRTEYFIGTTVGAAYKIIDMLSAALGLRYIYYTGNQTIKVTDIEVELASAVAQSAYDGNKTDWDISTDYSGHGFGLIIGFDIKPISTLNIGIRYEYYAPTALKKKTKSFKVHPTIEASGHLNIFKDGKDNDSFNGGAGYTDGNGESELKVTYPQSLSMGISYAVIKQLRLEAGADIYFRPYVDLDGREDDYNIGYRVHGCFELSHLIKNIILSAGYSYNDPGIKKHRRNEIDPLLISHTIGAGLGFKFSERIDLNVGFSYVIYMDAKVRQTKYTNVLFPVYDYYTTELGEETYSIAIGITCRFLGNDTPKKKSSSGDPD